MSKTWLELHSAFKMGTVPSLHYTAHVHCLFIWQRLPKIDSKLNGVHYCLVGGITGQQLRFQVSRDGVAESLMRGKFESS